MCQHSSSARKGPGSLHGEGPDDYASRFPGQLATACVTDVLRSRVECEDGSAMLRLMELLSADGGFVCTVDGKQATLELIRCKNKFPADQDPFHFRNALCNTRLTYDKSSAFAEIQIHHTMILAKGGSHRQHEAYEFFRSVFANAYGSKMDALLSRLFLFFDEIKGNPVLFSMLIVVIGARTKESAEELPTSIPDLYKAVRRFAFFCSTLVLRKLS